MNHVEDLLKSLYVMASMVEARDPYTGGHLWRVSQFSRMLAAESGLSGQEVARIAVGGFLHDLGKIGVPDAILNKPDRLTDDEYSVIKTHPAVGARLLAGHPLADMVQGAVLSHHERPDGDGYPQRLTARDIVVDARIVGICDAFDAMTSTRPYRRGMATNRALAIIEEALGRQFDAELGGRFLNLGRTGMLDPIVGHSDAGIPLQDCPLCGPVIVVRREHQTGDYVYCRHCGGEARVERVDDRIQLAPTGRRGSPSDLEADVDVALLADLARESARVIGAAID
jgi:hypothetical protein